MEMTMTNLWEGSKHASEDVYKEDGQDRDRPYVSENLLAQKRMKNFLTFGPHKMLPKFLSLFLLPLKMMTSTTRLKQHASIQKQKMSKMKLL
jgi:hypothetical protein